METIRHFVREVGHALRLLSANPGFTAVAVLSLALGIGLNATMFSIINALLFRPPAVERPHELISLYSSSPRGLEHSTTSYPDYVDFVEQNDVFSDLAGHSMMLASLQQEERSELLFGEVVTSNYFDVLGVVPTLGRAFRPDEDLSSVEAVAVLSHGFWQRRFTSAEDVLGRRVRLNGTLFTVVGVAPEGFTGTVPSYSPDLWVPVGKVEEIEPMGINDVEGRPTGDSRLEQRGRRFMFVTGRLREGASLAEARAQMGTIAERLAAAYPDSNEERTVVLLPASQVRFHPLIDSALAPVAVLLLGIVGVVLLIACANVANMLLAKASSRSREIALRLAVGASRAQLVRQLLVESLVLSLTGGLIGLLVAWWVTRAIALFQVPFPVTFTLDFALDGRVLAFTFLLSIVTGVLFGLAPALKASRSNLVSALRESSTDGASGSSRLGSLLVVGQVAASLVLLVGAGLLVRGVAAAGATELGFEPARLGLVTVNLEMNDVDEERGRLFFREALARVRALAGIDSATLVERLPFSFNINASTFYPPGGEPAEETGVGADVTYIEPGYFETIGVPLLRGRDFSEQDRADAPRVAIVNETFANRFWPDENPVGKRFQSGNAREYEVVGVAGNHKVRTVGEAPLPYVHFPRAQRYNGYATVLVRARGDIEETVERVRQELLVIKPDLVVMEASTMPEQMARTLLPARWGSVLLGGFSALAVLLASIGLYGLIAYWVSRRTKEVGVRVALGADTRRVLTLVVWRGMRLAIVGVGVGLVLAAILGRLLTSALYGVNPMDPWTLAVCSCVLLSVALLANLIPARRAANVDPMVSLRHE